MATMKKEGKKKSVGRPKGEEKEPVNLYLKTSRAESLREASRKRKQTISTIADEAFEMAGL